MEACGKTLGEKKSCMRSAADMPSVDCRKCSDGKHLLRGDRRTGVYRKKKRLQQRRGEQSPFAEADIDHVRGKKHAEPVATESKARYGAKQVHGGVAKTRKQGDAHWILFNKEKGSRPAARGCATASRGHIREKRKNRGRGRGQHFARVCAGADSKRLRSIKGGKRRHHRTDQRQQAESISWRKKHSGGGGTIAEKEER